MYLGTTYQDVVDNLKPLFAVRRDDEVIVCSGRKLWLLSLKRARYIKHHVARITAKELTEGLTGEKMATLFERIAILKQKGVL